MRPTAPRQTFGDRTDIVDRRFERRVDLIAHTVRCLLGLALLVAAWTSDLAGDNRTLFTIFLVFAFFPLSPFDYMLTPRFGGTLWFDVAVAAGHTTSVFAVAWLAPSLRPVALVGYVLLIVVFTTNGGRTVGLAVSAVSVGWAIVAEILVEEEERLAVANLVVFAGACVAVSLLVHLLTAERATKAAALEEALGHERELRRHLEEALDAKDRFVEAVTHELRTPLAVLRGALDLVRQSTRIDADQREFLLGRATERSLDLESIVSLVTEYTALDHDRRIEPAPTPLRVPIDAAVARFDGASARVVVHETDAVAYADAAVVERVIGLVVDNALKFSDPETPVQVIAGPGDDDTVAIAVTDQGRGIAPEDLDAIFEPFRQSGAMLPGTMGLGVGLALARRLCEQSGGVIDVSSRLAEGTTVTIRLPRG